MDSNTTPLGKIVSEEPVAPPKRYDYLGFYAAGHSTEEILQATKDGNIVPMSLEDADKHYRGENGIYKDLTDEQFGKLHTESMASYNEFAQNKYNGYVADRWLYDTPGGLTGDIDLNKPSSGWGNPGFDQFGQPTATPSEVAAARGYIIDTDGKQIKYDNPGFLGKMWAGISGIVGIVEPELAPLMQGKDPEKITTIQYDQEGMPVLMNKYFDDESILRSQIFSAWGPQPMEESIVTGLMKVVYNGVVPGIHSMIGSVMETTDDFIDFMAYGKDQNGWLDRQGRIIQNLAGANMMPVSAEGSQGAFSNIHSFTNAVGAMIPLILLTKGAGAGFGAMGMGVKGAHMAANFVTFAALGIDGHNQAAKELGIDPADASWQSMLIGMAHGGVGMLAAPKFLTGKLDAVEMKSAIAKRIVELGKKFEAQVGTKLSKMTPDEKLSFVKRSSNSVLDFYKNYMTDITTKTGRFVNAAHGGGRMIALMQPPSVIVETLNDWNALMKDPGAEPGKGMFEEYDTNRSFLSQVIEKAPNRMIESYAIGFLGSMAMGLPSVFAKQKAQTTNSIVARGKEAEAIKIMGKGHSKGEWGRTDMTPEGNIITSDMVGKPGVKSINDVVYEQAVQEIQQLVEIRDAHNLRHPQMLAVFGGNPEFAEASLSIMKGIHDTKAELAKIEAQGVLDEAGMAHAESLKASIRSQEIVLNDIIKPEQGSKFSKVYNESFKNKSASFILAKEDVDESYKKAKGKSEVTEKDRNTGEYMKLMQVHKLMSNPDMYSGVKQFNTKKARILEEAKAKQKAYRDAKGETTGKLTKLTEKLTQVDPTRTTSAKELMTTGRGLIKEIQDLSSTLDMNDAGNELAVKAKQTFSETMQKINDQLNEISDPLDSYTDITGAITEPGFAKFSEPTVSKAKIRDEAYVGREFENTNGTSANSLKSQEAAGWPNWGGAWEQSQNIKAEIEKNRNAALFNSKVLADSKVKEHMSATDEPITDVQAKKYIKKLDALARDVEKFQNTLKAEKQKYNNYQDKTLVHHIEKSKFALRALNNLLVKLDLSFRGLIDALPDWTKEEKDLSIPITNKQKLYEANRQLTEIKAKIFEKRAEILKDENLAELEAIIGSRQFTAGVMDAYLKTKDYNPTQWEDFNEVMDITDGADFMGQKKHGSKTVDLGYIYTVNFLVESVGANAKEVEVARQKMREASKSEDVSSIEQQMAENLIFSFKNDAEGSATKMFEKILEFEKKKIGSKSYDEIVTDSYVPGLIYIRGEYKTGKTTQVLRNVYMLDKFYNEKTSRKIVVIGISDHNKSVLSESFRGLGLDVRFMTDVEFMKNKAKQAEALSMDDIVIDEASLLSASHLKSLKKHNANGRFKILAMGDDGQMKSLKDAKTYPDVEESGLRTSPLMTKYSKDQPLVNNIANAFGKKSAKSTRSMPEAHTKVNEKGEKEGAMYFKDVASVVDSFLKSVNPNRKLIVTDQEAWLGADGVTGLKSKIPIELHDKVFVISKEWGESGPKDGLQSVQGLRGDEIYIAVDRATLSNEGIADEPIRRLMYTATGRAASWVGLIDPAFRELNKASPEEVNWVDSPATDLETMKAKNDIAWNEDMTRLSHVTGIEVSSEKGETSMNTAAARTSERMLENDPLIGAFYHIVGGEHDGKFAFMDSVEGGKMFFGVGETMKDAQNNTAFTDRLVPLKTADLEYLDDAAMKLAEPNRTAEKPVQTIPLIIHKIKETVARWTGNKEVWGTTYSVVGEVNLSKKEIKMKRKITPILHKMVNTLFEPELVYMAEPWMEGRSGKMEPQKDVLAIRLNMVRSKEATLLELQKVLPKEAYETIQKHLEGKDQLPDHFRYIISLAQPETLKDGKAGFRNNENILKVGDINVGNLAEKQAMIKRGYIDAKDGDKHSAMNSTLAEIIAYAKVHAKDSPDGIVSIKTNISFDGPENYKSKVDQSSKTTKWEDFKAKFKAQGVKFATEVERIQVSVERTDFKTGEVKDVTRQQYVVRFSHGEVKDNGSYIILRKPKLSEIATEHNLPDLLSRKMEEDIKKIKTLAGTRRGKSSNALDVLKSTFLFEFIKNNQGVIKGKGSNKEALDVITKFGKFQVNKSGYTDFWLNSKDNTTYDEVIKSFEGLWKEILTGENLKKFMDLEVPFTQKKQVLKDNIEDPFEQFYAFGEEIHAPYSFVSLDGITPPEIGSGKTEAAMPNAEIPVKGEAIADKPASKPMVPKVDPKRDDVDLTDGWDAPPKTHEIPKDNPTVRRASIAQVETLFQKIAHPDVWKQIDADLVERGIAPLQYDGKWLYGMMRDGKIKLELTENGVELTTPKHEFFHMVFNYMIRDEGRAILIKEAKDALRWGSDKRYRGKKNSDISDRAAEEFIAKRYGETGLETDSKIPTKKNILQRFINMVRKLFGKFEASTYEMDNLMYRIDHGAFKDIMPVIKEGQEIIRLNEREAEDLPDTSHLQYYNTEVPRIFGRKEIIDSVRRRVEQKLNLFTDFSNNPDMPHMPLSDAIIRLEQGLHKFRDLGIEKSGFVDPETGNLKYINQMSMQEFMKSSEADHLSPKDYNNYVMYQLSNPVVRRAFLQRIFPGLNFDSMELGKYNSSTQFESRKNWSPEQSKSDFMKFQMRITPLMKFDQKGNPIGSTSETVNYRDLDRSLKQAGVETMLRFRGDPSKSPREHFIAELRKLADDVLDDNPKRQNILSFINRFYEGNTEYKSLDQVTKILRDSKDPEKIRRAENIEDFLTATSMYYSSFSYNNRGVMRISKNRNGESFYSFETYARSTAEHEKNRIVDTMKWRLFSNGVPKTKVTEGLGMARDKYGVPAKGQAQIFEVGANGLSFVKGKGRTPESIIEISNGKVVFSKRFEENPGAYLTEIQNILGLNSVNQSAFMSLIRGTASEGAKRLLKEKSPLVSDNFDSNKFMAEGLMNLFWSMKSNIDSVEKLRNIDDKIGKIMEGATEADDYDSRVIRPEVQSLIAQKKSVLNEPMFKKEMATFRRDTGVNGTVDGQEAMMGDADLVSKGDYQLPKPTDYYNVFNVLGLVNTYQKGLDFDSHFYAPDGTRQWNFKLHSKFSLLFDGGSRWMIDHMETLKNEGKLAKSPYWDPARKMFTNQLHDPKGIELKASYDYSGIKMGDRGTTNPNTRDLNNMAFHAWFDGIIKSSSDNWQKNIFLTTNIGDKTTQFANIFDFSPANGKNKFLRLQMDETGKVIDAKVDEDFINRSISTHFFRINRQHELSKQRWLEFSATKEGKALSSIIPKEIWAKGEDIDITSARIQEWSKTLTSEQIDQLYKSDLMLGTDYVIKGDKVSFGNALLWKVEGYDDVYNFHNFKNVIEPGKLDAKTRDLWFNDKYKGMASKMSKKQSQFTQREDVKNLIRSEANDGTAGFFRSVFNGRRAWQGRILEMNPVYKAFFYGYHIANNALGDIAYGSIVDHGNLTTKGKRSIQTHTPASRIDVSGKYSLGKKAREIAWFSDKLKDLNTEEYAEVADGADLMGMFYESFFKKSIGGFDYGPVDKTMYKTLNTDVSFESGTSTHIKKASDAFSGQLFNSSLVIRKMNFDILDTMDAEMKKIYGENYEDGMLRNKFEELWNKDKSDPGKAFDLLRDWSVDEAILKDGTRADQAIKDNMISGFTNITAHKQMVNRINRYDPADHNAPVQLRSREISNEGLSIILNPYQNIADKGRLAPMQQILSMIGIGHEANKITGRRLNQIQAELYKMGKGEINAEIEKYKTDPELSPEKQFMHKFSQFLVDRGMEMVKAMGTTQNFADLIADPKTFMVPQVYTELKRSYRNYVNKNAIKVPMTGIRLNQSTGIVIEMYRGKDGNQYSLQDIERNYPEHVKALPKGYISHPSELPEGYESTTITEMTRGENQNNKAGIAMPFLYRQEFGLRPEETLNDVFTIRLNDGQWINTRYMNKEAIDDYLVANEANIDINNTPMLREVARFDGMDNFRDAMNQVLDAYASRVPASSLGSGASSEVVMFAEGNGNTGYKDPRATIYGNDDFDIDQISTYLKKLLFGKDGKWLPAGDAKSKLQNEMLDLIHAVYADPMNAERIFTKSSTKELRDAADEMDAKLNRKGSRWNSDNDYASTLEMNNQAKEGADGIDIAANTLTAYSTLAQVLNSGDVPGIKGALARLNEYGYESIGRRIERVLQTLLDNAKELAIGRLGITQDSVNLLGPFIMARANKTSAETTTEMGEFFSDPLVKKVLIDVEMGNSIEESRRAHYIFNAIHKAKTELNPISTKEHAAKKIELDALEKEFEAYKEDIAQRVIKSEDRLPDSKVYKSRMLEYMEAVEPELKDEYYRLEDEINELKEQFADSKGKVILDELYDYAVQAEAMRRLSEVISVRNGTKTDDFDFTRAITSIQNHLGMTLKEYIDGTKSYERTSQGEESRIADHLEYFKKNNNEWQYVQNGENAERTLKAEADIAKVMNLQEVVRGLDHISEFIKEYENQPKLFKSMSWEEHPVKDQIVKEFLRRQKLFSFDFKARSQAIHQAWQKVFLDYYFKTFQGDKTYDLSIPKEDKLGGFRTPDTIFNEMNLTSDIGRNNFSKQFPEYHNFILFVAKMPKHLARNAIREMNGGFFDTDAKADQFYEAIANNKFLQNMINSGRAESPFLKLNDGSLTPEQILMYSMEFKRLPEWLQEAYTYNQYINTGFSFKQGSILDIIGKEIYTRPEGIAEGMEGFKLFLDNLPEAGLKDLSEKFYNFVIKEEGAVAYVSKAMKKEGYQPEAELGNKYLKSSLGEGGMGVKTTKVFDPLDTKSKDGMVDTYSVTGRGGFDMDHSNSLRGAEPLRLSAEELDYIMLAQKHGVPARFTKTYVRGHGYKVGDYVWADGVVMQVIDKTATSVSLEFGNKTEGELLQARRHKAVTGDSAPIGIDPAEMELHSGGAEGADTYWGKIAEKYGIKRAYHYFSGKKTPGGNTEITKEQLEEGWGAVLQANESLKRTGIEKYKDLLARNWHQVKNSDSVLAIGKMKDGKVDGGTGWAVQMAIDAKKPLFVFDQKSEQWYKYDYTKKDYGEGVGNTGFVKLEDGVTPTLTRKFAGVGTREINGAGKRAIDNVFKVSFGEAKTEGATSESREIRNFNEFEGRRHTQRVMETLITKLQSKFPEIGFRTINSVDAKAYGKSATIRGWVEGKNVFLNIDTMKSITGVHEMQHIWNKIYESIDPARYASFEDHVRSQILSKEGDIYRLSEEVKRTYPELKNDHKGLVDEMMATMGGFVSEKAVERFLRKSNSRLLVEDASLPRRLYESVKNAVIDLWENVMKSLGIGEFDLQNKDLKDFYLDFTNKIFSGNEQFKFTPEEMEIIKQVTGESKAPERKMMKEMIDMIPFLSHKPSDPMKLANLDTETLTNYLYGQIINNSGGGSNYYFYVGKKPFKFPVSAYRNNPEKLKAAIKKQIVPEYELLEKELPNFLKAFIPQVHEAMARNKGLNRELAMREIADNVFGPNRISDSVLSKMATHLGIFNEIKEVVRYQELSGHKDPNVRGLYRPEFEGFNPLVLIHGIEADGTVSVSLIDATSKPLGEKTDERNIDNIFSNMMSDKEYRQNGGPEGWGNKLHSARRFMLGLQMMSMQQANPKIRFRNIGVVEIHGNSLKSFPITDTREVTQLVKILRGNKEFMESIESESLRNLIMNKKFDEEVFQQSYISRMNYWLQDQLEKAGEDQYTARKTLGSQLGVLFNPSATRQDIYDVFVKRRMDLEAKYPDPQKLFADEEYQMLSNAIFEMKNERIGFANKMHDMSRLSKRVMSPVNHHSDLVQRVVAVSKIAKDIVVNKYMGEYHNPMNKLLAEVVKDYRLKHPGDNLGALGRDMGGKFFESMWKKRIVRVSEPMRYKGKNYQAGETIEVRIPELHWDINNADTKIALGKGEVTMKEIEASKAILEFIKQRQIDNILHNALMDVTKENRDELGKAKYTRKMAEAEYDNIFSPEMYGMIPTMERSINELIMGKDVKRGMAKFWESMGRDNEFFDDELGSSKELDGVGDAFSEQMGNPMKMYEKMGLRRGDDGEMELFNADANNLASANVERIGNYFMLQSIRKDVYEKEVLPMFNTAQAIMTAMGSTDGRFNQKVNMAFLNELKNRFVFRKNADDTWDATIPLLGAEIHVKSIARSLMHSFTNLVIFGRPIIGVKSLFFNETRRAMASLAMSAANIGIAPELRGDMPTTLDAEKATLKFTTDPGKMIALGRMFHIINRNERDLIESPFLNLSTKTNMLQEQWGHIWNYGSDVGSRMVAAASWMIHEGSWDAYEFDAKTGDVKYDIKKDARYYKPDGTQTIQQQTLHNALLTRLRDQGLQGPEDAAIRGHDWDLVNNQLKWYGEKWVVSGMDELTKTLVSNMYISAMFAQFRLFSFEPLFNAGVFADTRETIGGSKFKAIQDENGNWISTRELRKIEGSYQSFSHAFKSLLDLRKLSADEISFKKWWTDMPETRRFNIARTIIQTASFATLAALLAPMLSEDDSRKYSWLYSELAIGFSAAGWLNNPIPMIKGAIDLTQIAIGNRDMSRLIKFTGPVQGITELIPSSED